MFPLQRNHVLLETPATYNQLDLIGSYQRSWHEAPRRFVRNPVTRTDEERLIHEV